MTNWLIPENELELVKAVKENNTIANVIRSLGLVPAGGNYRTIKQHIERLALDTSHHKGKAWSRGIYKKPSGDYLSNDAMKRWLIKSFGHQCDCCQLTEWCNKPITLELEHRDGNNSNNDLNNLRLLCCNCHAMTPTWRRKK